MSSSQVYPALTGTIDPGQMAVSSSSEIAGSEWYAQSSYAFHDPYMTPYPSSTIESQPWSTYARASVPGIHLGEYPVHQQSPPPQQQHHHQHQLPGGDSKDPGRPRSSPSTFGPSADSLTWTTSGLGIQYTTAGQATPPVSSSFAPNVFQSYAAPEEGYSTSSPPEIRHPQPRRSYTSIAPNPAGVAAKRKRDEDDQTSEMAVSASGSARKQRKRTSSVASADLSEDDRFLVQLKEDENLPWKDIATRFQTDKGKNFQVAALQMRYKRLREKFRIWEEQDVNALKLAHEYWEKYKWEIISAKMLDFGIQERWPARHCARKFQDVEAHITPFATPGPPPATTTSAGAAMNTPASISQFSSPVEGPVHFAFMPIQ